VPLRPSVACEERNRDFFWRQRAFFRRNIMF
jgi:hypothetical protein